MPQERKMLSIYLLYTQRDLVVPFLWLGSRMGLLSSSSSSSSAPTPPIHPPITNNAPGQFVVKKIKKQQNSCRSRKWSNQENNRNKAAHLNCMPQIDLFDQARQRPCQTRVSKHCMSSAKSLNIGYQRNILNGRDNALLQWSGGRGVQF